MMTLDKYCSIIDRNKPVELRDSKGNRLYFATNAKDIPAKYAGAVVEDFTMSDSGRLTFKLRMKTVEASGLWQEGTVKVGNSWYRYWVRAYDEPSEYGIDGGRISKLTIKRQDETVVNYDRGWDVEPADDGAKAALAIIRSEYDK